MYLWIQYITIHVTQQCPRRGREQYIIFFALAAGTVLPGHEHARRRQQGGEEPAKAHGSQGRPDHEELQGMDVAADLRERCHDEP